MSSSICVTVLAALAALATSGSLSAAEPVKVTGGLLEETTGTDPSVRVFRGVPFAAPPVGSLRWKAPQPVTPWTGVRKADTWGTRCMQAPMFGPPLVSRETEMAEDCLYLNVWTTARADEKRPVLVVFHGGGFAADPRPSRAPTASGSRSRASSWSRPTTGWASSASSRTRS